MMGVVQKRRIGLFLIFMAFLFSFLHLDQVSFTNNYVSFIEKQYISVKRDHLPNNFVMSSSENKSRIRTDENGFSIWEKIEEKGGKRGFEGREAVPTKLHVASSTKESKSAKARVSPTPTSRLSRIESVSASR